GAETILVRRKVKTPCAQARTRRRSPTLRPARKCLRISTTSSGNTTRAGTCAHARAGLCSANRGENFYIAFLYGDFTDESAFLRSFRAIWREIKSDNVEEMSRKIVESGLLRKLEVPDHHENPCSRPRGALSAS